jgi:hypothetical protein
MEGLMIQYDASVIYKFAERLYRNAQTTIALYTVVGVLLGLGGGFSIEAV